MFKHMVRPIVSGGTIQFTQPHYLTELEMQQKEKQTFCDYSTE